LSVGCLPGTDPPQVDVGAPPASCGNGTCEPAALESCVNCPKDCPCCYAVLATLGGGDASAALGAPDSKTVDLGPDSTLELHFGREMIANRAGPDAPDLELTGSVETDTPALQQGCQVPTEEHLQKAVQVQAFDGAWKVIGWWTKGGASKFLLNCASISRSTAIRLTTQPQARAKLDAAHATSCYSPDGQ